MKDKYLKVSLNVIAVFMTVILMSFVPGLVPNFFGDTLCQGSGHPVENPHGPNYYQFCNYGNSGFHEPEWHWGYQHWLWFIMGICLFIIQAVRIINIIDAKEEEKK